MLSERFSSLSLHLLHPPIKLESHAPLIMVRSHRMGNMELDPSSTRKGGKISVPNTIFHLFINEAFHTLPTPTKHAELCGNSDFAPNRGDSPLDPFFGGVSRLSAEKHDF